jgi:hypothetical protein
MKTPTNLHTLAAALLIVLASASIAAAQSGTDTCAGASATIGESCTPLTNSSSGDNDNSAFGYLALSANHAGQYNTAIGANTLQANTQGAENTATGSEVLQANTSGGDNTATGSNALEFNTTGSDNTATGAEALGNNTAGQSNTANGLNALSANISGNANTAVGYFALQQNTSGHNNTALGNQALGDNTGNYNIGIGDGAGDVLTTGSNNIDIGNEGGNAGGPESGTIRIGTQGLQTATFIAGIFGTAKIKKGCEVVVENSGLLGCVKSSARYKRDIRDMGDASDKLMKLRPVRFAYKDDTTGVQQYGLIAEEVEKVYPELVIDGADGRAETVEYQILPAMLLNEVQKQHKQIEQRSAEVAALRAQVTELKASMRRQNVAFKQRLSRIEQEMASRDGGRNIAAAFNR